jgi:predicted DNA repair protein MutK
VALRTKAASRKTAGVLGDDLALNAQQVAGLRAEHELPVVWAVAKGSLVNKAILVPAALAISAFAPWAVVPLLMTGGAYLCYEGFEKLAHRLLHRRAEDDAHHAELRTRGAQCSGGRLRKGPLNSRQSVGEAQAVLDGVRRRARVGLSD